MRLRIKLWHVKKKEGGTKDSEGGVWTEDTVITTEKKK